MRPLVATSLFVTILLAMSIAIAEEATRPKDMPASAPASQPISRPASQPAKVYTDWPFDAKEAARRQDETAKNLGVPKELLLDLGKKVALKLVLIPAGTFMMGSPDSEEGHGDDETKHEVTITKPFYIGVYAVTQEQYEV